MIPAAARAERAPRRKGIRRQTILEAARRLFTAKGYGATSVAEIARAAGVADGTVYLYFASKRELLSAVLHQLYDPSIDRLASEVREVSGFANVLKMVVERHLRLLSEDPQLCRLVLQEIRSAPDYENSAAHKLNRRYASVLTRAVEDAVRSGELRADLSARFVRDVVYGSIEHLVWQSLSRGSPINVERMTADLTGLLLPGLLRLSAGPESPGESR